MENLWLAAALAVLVVAERLPRLRLERLRLLRRGFASDLIYLASGALGLGLLLRQAGIRWVEAMGAAVPGLSTLPFPLALMLATLLYDLASYASHLALHRSEPLWRLHKVHHSSPALDWLATFRGHIVEHALRHAASTGMLLAVGFPLGAVAGAATLYAAWAAFGHSNLRAELRFLEPVFITPRLHRLHHVPHTSERNLGTIFTFWDRLRGNLVTGSTAPAAPLGIPGEIDSYPQSWLPQLLQPFREAPRRVLEPAPPTRGPHAR